MYKLDIYHRVRRAVRIDDISERAAAIAFGISIRRRSKQRNGKLFTSGVDDAL